MRRFAMTVAALALFFGFVSSQAHQTLEKKPMHVKRMSAEARKGPTYLYLEVDNFDAVLTAMKGVKIVMPVRISFYGMKEFAVQDPGGHSLTFAQQAAAPQP